MIVGRVNTGEGSQYKRWIGVCPVKVVAVNPKTAEIAELFPYRQEVKEQEYLKQVEYKGVMHKEAIVSMFLEGEVPDGSKPIFNLRIHLFDTYMFNGDKSKTQVIDKYAQTAWLATEDVRNKAYKQEWEGKIDKDYRPAIVGEAALTSFMQTFFGIPKVRIYKDGAWVLRPEAERRSCECRLDNIKEVFEGNFAEIIGLLREFKDNKLKVMVGINRTEDGRIYQKVNERTFAHIRSTSLRPFERELANMTAWAMKNGTTLSTVYSAREVHEYIPEQSIAPSDGDGRLWSPDTTKEAMAEQAPMHEEMEPRRTIFDPIEDNDDLPF